MTLYIVKRTSKNKSIQINQKNQGNPQVKYLKLNVKLVKDYYEHHEPQHSSDIRESIIRHRPTEYRETGQRPDSIRRPQQP